MWHDGKKCRKTRKEKARGGPKDIVTSSPSYKFPNKLLFPKFPKHALSQRLCPVFFFSVVSLLVSRAPASEPSQSIRKKEGEMGTIRGRCKINESFLVWQGSLNMGGSGGKVSAATFFVLMLQLSYIHSLSLF